ncbi:MAG: OmpA family protein [Desulfobulbus sp.]|nr:OmpA family protein [Desulfobulbus sp.]
MNSQSTAPSQMPSLEKGERPSTGSSQGILDKSLRPRDWNQGAQPVFVIEESFFRSRTPARPAHWSIAWSDLMMTMFILFLTLFAHLKSQQQIAAHGVPNKVADETIPVQVEDAQNALVFHPISQDVSLKISEQAQEIIPPQRESSGADVLIRHQMAEDGPHRQSVSPIPELPHTLPQPEPHLTPQVAEATEPNVAEAKATQPQDELITKIYDLSKIAVEQEKLEKFASVELIPDKTMRIILTGDLLFASGQIELTESAIASLQKLSAIIKETPYMINVIGHTDDRPVKSVRFPSNWELSLARASQVARFLIDSTGLPPTQFRVTGYSYYRPLRPNTSEENRKINRRVEIVLSKELPQVQAAPPANLQ